MKLAEALILRADLQKKVEQLKSRILTTVKVQEGDTPVEEPNGLLQELRDVREQLTSLIQRINRTNAAVDLSDTLTMADALAERSALQAQHLTLRDIAKQASVTQTRFSRSEVKFVTLVNVRELQAEADQLAKSQRDLDSLIQAANWNTELL